MRADVGAATPSAQSPPSTPNPTSTPRSPAWSPPIRVSAPCWRTPGGRRCGGGRPGLPGSAAIVCAQQFSTASAGAIWGRLAAAFDPFHHDTMRRARADKLARLGLSAPKISTLKAIAGAIARGESISTRWRDATADDAHAALTALHGIGPWTADIYLLFCLGHADAWPAGDLALQEAARSRSH